MIVNRKTIKRLAGVLGALLITLPGMASGAVSTSKAPKGLVLFNSESYPAAAEALAEESVRHPYDLGLKLSLAVALLQIKDYQRAAAVLDKAAQMAPAAGIIRTLRLSAVPSPGERGTPGPAFPVYAKAATDGSISALTIAAQAHPQSAAVANLLGDAYQMADNTAKAEEWYGRASALAPGWSKPRVSLALALLGTEPARAASLLELVLQKEPANSQARLWLGDAYTALGKQDLALSEYRSAEKDPATRVDAQVRLGATLLRDGQIPAATRVFEKAQAADPSNAAAQTGVAQTQALQNNIADARKAMQRARESSREASPQQQAAVLNNYAQVAASSGDTPEAEHYFDSAASLDPTQQSVYRDLAELYLKAGDLATNNNIREIRLQSHPDDIRSLRYLVEGYQLAGDTDGQIRALDALAEKDAGGAWGWKMRLADVHWKSGHKEEAFQVWLSSVDLGYPTRTVTIAKSISSLPGAAQFVEERLTASPKSRTASHLLFALDLSQGRLEPALRALDAVLASDPANSTLYGQKAYLLRRLGRTDEAEALQKQRLPSASSDPPPP